MTVVGRHRFLSSNNICTPWHHNAILVNWGAAVLLGAVPALGVEDAHLDKMYLEFDTNGASAGPTFDPTSEASGLSYYASLSAHPSRDYLRVPIIAAKLIKNHNKYIVGNILTVIAQTSGGVGVHGKILAAGGALIGAALVCSRSPTDITKDLIFSRSYHNISQQLIMPATGSIYSEWQLDFSR